TVDFDPGPGISNLTAQWNDVFIQKLDSNGTFLWAKKVGGLDSEIINSLKLDEFGNIYAIGTFGNTADFDPGSGIATITSQGNSDVFILKLDNQGNYKWAKAFGGTEFDFGYSLSIDKKGRVHSVGAFQGVVDFNPGPPSHLQTSNGQGDIYVQTLDSNGNFINVTTAGSSKYDYGRFTSISPSGDVYILGNFRDTVNVPYNGLGTSILSNGDLDVFIIKLSYCTPDTTFDSQTVCDKLTWIDGQTYYQSVDSLTHTLQNRYGCDSMVLLDLNVTNSDTSISLNGDTLTSNQISASYQWLNCIDSFNVIPLATNQSYTPTQNGDYAVEVSRNGCKDTSSCISITKLGITENSLKHSFRIYPNPTKGELTIEFDKRHSKIQAQLLSITRQVIDSKTVSNTNSLSFDLDAAKGIYLLELITENEGKAVVRIVKE
ncbi:MAG: T9SS type A sorting domain-containing protein, partial [Bacteroidia bacterium]